MCVICVADLVLGKGSDPGLDWKLGGLNRIYLNKCQWADRAFKHSIICGIYTNSAGVFI